MMYKKLFQTTKTLLLCLSVIHGCYSWSIDGSLLFSPSSSSALARRSRGFNHHRFDRSQPRLWASNSTNEAVSPSMTMIPYHCNEKTLSETEFISEMNKQLVELQQQSEVLSPIMPASMGDVEHDGEDISASSSADDHEAAVWRARFLLLGAAALYGTNFSLVKLLGDAMPVGVSSTMRFGLAALATMPWLLKLDERPQQQAEQSEQATQSGIKLPYYSQDSWGAARLGFEVGLWNSIGYVSQAIGLQTTAASKSAFLCSLAVVTVPLLDFAVGKRLKGKQWVGALLAVLGVAFLEFGGAEPLQQLTTGDLCSLVQPFAFGMGFWRMEKAMHDHPNQANRSTAAQLFAVFVMSAIYCVSSISPDVLASYPWHSWLTDTSLLFSLFWTGVITTAMTIYMETLALKTLSAAETTLIFSTEPLSGTAFAAVVMGEQLSKGDAIGAILILAGCIFSNLGLDGLKSLFQNVSRDNNVTSATNNKDNSSSTRTGGYTTSDIPSLLSKKWIWLCSTAAVTLGTLSTAIDEKGPLKVFLDLGKDKKSNYSFDDIQSTIASVKDVISDKLS